tara:strand:+ start:164 stop:316 length:153 start_codon:yes stop_codon:yes gene_type:complete
MTESNPFLRSIINQLIMFGHSDEEILAVVTDKVRPLTIERLTNFRHNLEV